MEKFTKVTGVAAPLMRQNVDTDLIIRIERLVSNTGRKGSGLLLRADPLQAGRQRKPDCVFNQAPYRDAHHPVGREFRLRSSREGAVWRWPAWA
jgi:3-isopropylmalate/(R)-2-methylmalate dehydratase small subunit